MRVRQRGVGPARHNRIKRGTLEPRATDSPVDRQRNLALVAPAQDFFENAERHRRQPARRFAERFNLVGILAQAEALDKALGRHKLGRRRRLLQRRAQPLMTADREVRRFESDPRGRQRPQQ